MSCWHKHIGYDLSKGLLPCDTAFGGLVTMTLTLDRKNPLLVTAIQLCRKKSLWLFQRPCIGYRHYHFRGQVLCPLKGCNGTKKGFSKVQRVKKEPKWHLVEFPAVLQWITRAELCLQVTETSPLWEKSRLHSNIRTCINVWFRAFEVIVRLCWTLYELKH